MHVPVEPVSHVFPEVCELLITDCSTLVLVKHADLVAIRGQSGSGGRGPRRSSYSQRGAQSPH